VRKDRQRRTLVSTVSLKSRKLLSYVLEKSFDITPSLTPGRLWRRQRRVILALEGEGRVGGRKDLMPLLLYEVLLGGTSSETGWKREIHETQDL
jgi:hypothetical protein